MFSSVKCICNTSADPLKYRSHWGIKPNERHSTVPMVPESTGKRKSLLSLGTRRCSSTGCSKEVRRNLSGHWHYCIEDFPEKYEQCDRTSRAWQGGKWLLGIPARQSLPQSGHKGFQDDLSAREMVHRWSNTLVHRNGNLRGHNSNGVAERKKWGIRHYFTTK